MRKKPEDVTAEELDTMAVGDLETVLIEIEAVNELDEATIEAASHALTYIDNELPELRLEVKRLREALDRLQSSNVTPCPHCCTTPARYFSAAEVVRCPKCGLLDVSNDSGAQP